jgi:hypothetical protein
MPTATKTKEEETIVDIMEPSSMEYTLILGEGGGDPLTFTQKPLSFMGKIKLFSVLSETLRKVMDEDVSISDLLDAPESDSLPLSGNASKEADIFIKSIASVLEYAPEALGDIFCVILAVPVSQQEYVKTRLDEDLTDDQAFAVLNTFVDQNWEILYDFFTGKGMNLFKKVTGKFQR